VPAVDAVVSPIPGGNQASTGAPTSPDRPRLAEGVFLVGVLPGSGFDATQFLVRRGPQFVQVTELLFRTLEALDGRRTYGDIAERLTETTHWSVAPDQARLLVVEKLMPLGLVGQGAIAQASTGLTDETTEEVKIERSMLSVQAPRTLLGATAIDRVASVVHHVFAPIVAVPLLTLVIGAHAWMYLRHGVLNGLLEVLYAPGLLLAVVVLIVVAGIVHEFGHAAGLRYGGGRAGSMGVGLYLVYPAFYTDVSQSYAMPRTARLRTDLGGIYFHLLFALALIAIYQVTGLEVLLFAVLLIDIEAIRQLIPFGRLDGYWILADLTGIPDPLSQIPPFLRRAVSQERLGGARLPQLRPWVARTFVAYIALALPVIGLFILFLLSRLPQLVGLVWDALRLQAAQLMTAAMTSQTAIVILAVLQIALLGLELVATGFIVSKLGVQAAKGIAALGQRGGRARVAAVGLAAALIGGLTFLWGPHFAGLSTSADEGVAYYDVASRKHVDGSVRYERYPPVGGDHASVWQNCGFYGDVVPAERAVHSMEHGAVWITFRPDLPADQLAELRSLAAGRSHLLVSAMPDDPAPIVASAWGRQLMLDRVDDPRLDHFIRAFRLGSQAPERGGPCQGGSGVPEGT
jgi:putative peptide zinc metalloprotease protein